MADDSALVNPIQDSIYRTQGYRPGQASALRSYHVHLDGGDVQLARSYVELVETNLNLQGKVNKVLGALPGPQRSKESLTYATHTPIDRDKRENFTCFSTACFSDRESTLGSLPDLHKFLRLGRGMVLEAELVVGQLANGVFSWDDQLESEPFSEAEFAIRSLPSLPYELHHAISIPNQEHNLEFFATELTRLGIDFGGIFCFEKCTSQLEIRTNAFREKNQIQEAAEEEHIQLVKFVTQFGGKVRSLAERILGIWNAQN